MAKKEDELVMKMLKGIGNIFGILMAWVLSIALVIMLIVSPIVIAALSLLTPETVTDFIHYVFQKEEPVACAPVFDSASMHGSSSGTDSTIPTIPDGIRIPDQSTLGDGLANLLGQAKAESILSSLTEMVSELDLSAVEEVLGVEITPESVENVLYSQVAVEVLTPYIEDVANVFLHPDNEKKFTEEKVVEVVEKNLDEIVELILGEKPEADDKKAAELKVEIQTAISVYADDIVNALPQPEKVKEQIKEEIVADSPEMEETLDTALEILANREKIDLALMAVVAVLALLIFICRIPGLRGFRWLATILLIAGIVHGLLGGGLLLNSAVLMDILPAEMAGMSGVIERFVTAFATNILKQAGVMLGVAATFAVIYKVVRKIASKK